MIRWRLVLALIGLIVQAFGLITVGPAALALLYGEMASVWGFLLAAGSAIGIGFAMTRLNLGTTFDDLERLEGLAVVALGWFFIAVFGAIPYLWAGLPWMDALFESMSGFTTTGATVITDFTRISRSVFFFRGVTHWVGGMGILVLFVAILPHLAVAGRQLFFAETSSATKEQLTPRIKDTARRLYGWYVLLTLIETLLLMGRGMSFNDAAANSMATLAAGGFSPDPQSILGYHDPWTEWIIIVFMFLAGANFTLQVRALRGNWKVLWEDVELKFYGLIILLTTLALTFTLAKGPLVGSALEALRTALFQVLSIITTTGFATVDFNLWPDQAKAILAILMMIGGCSGSAGGGIKVIRVLAILRYLGRQLQRLIHPRAVIPVRLGSRSLHDAELQPILSFVLLYFLLFLSGGFLVACLENDLVLGFSGAIATLGNIGPGFGAIGPMGCYAGLTLPSKMIYFFLMWAGRLEVVTLLVLFKPEIWQSVIQDWRSRIGALFTR